jgi:parallel beta-helix repeat protein
MTLALLFVSIFAGAFHIQTVRASPGTIYIRADGSIDPPTAPISTTDNVTYTLTGNITCEAYAVAVVVQRSKTIIDGNGYTLQGVGSGHGFDLYNIRRVKVTHINIEGFEAGIRLFSTSDNIISGNNITNNGYGIYFSYFSDYNKFYHNNFVDNTLQVEFHPQSGYTNFCDNEYPSGGNYWSDYSGTDANHDGIGDTPYVIDANNTDHYPLVTQYAIPEFPSFLLFPLIIATTVSAIIMSRKKHSRFTLG